MTAPFAMTLPKSKEAVRPSIAVIVPSLRGNVDRLLNRLRIQTWVPDEIQVVKGVRPNGRARNMGVAALNPANGRERILVFIDDDAIPGTQNLIEKMVAPLLEEKHESDGVTGISGVARVLPGDSTWFQRRVAAEIPRTVNPVPDRLIETNPPLKGYGHSLITTTCCAMRQATFQEAGGFSEQLTSGVDTDFFYRVRSLGYRFVMPSDVFVEHPAPRDLLALWKKFYWYGLGYGQEVQHRQEQKMGPRLPTRLHRLGFLAAATLWLFPNIFFLYSYSYPHFTFGFRPIKSFSTYAVAWGYVASWQGRER